MKFSIIIAVLFVFSINAGAQKPSAHDLTEKGRNEFEKNNLKEALILLNDAIETDKNYYTAYFIRGTIKLTLGDMSGAMRDFDRVIKINPKYVEAYISRGNLKYAMQDYQGAINDYTLALEANDDLLDVYYKRGQAKLQMEAYSEAINDCDKIINVNPRNNDAYFLRGIIKIEYGQLREGCKDLSKAGELGDLKAYDEIRKSCVNIDYYDRNED